MKKWIVCLAVVGAFVACKKKKTEEPQVIATETPTPGGSSNSSCYATSIVQYDGASKVAELRVTYNGAVPSKIEVDSNGTNKILLNLDEKGVIKSGKFPVSFEGIDGVVTFESKVKLDSEGHVLEMVRNSTKLEVIINNNLVELSGSSAVDSSLYQYDASGNLISVIHALQASIDLGFSKQKISIRDSIRYSDYANGRPGKKIKYTRDVTANEPYQLEIEDLYSYDAYGNRTEVKRASNNSVKEKTTFTAEVYPAPIFYLLDIEGNPNYKNKDQDTHFYQERTTYSLCTASVANDKTTVSKIDKTTSGCLGTISFADTTTSCAGAKTASVSKYEMGYGK